MANYCVIGASSGIGKAIVLQLANTDNTIYATFNKNEVEHAQPNITYHKMNVLDDPLSFHFLPETLDGLVYCPGSINLKPFERIKPEDFLKDFQLQVAGAIKVIQNLLPKLKKSSNASIVLFSTVAVQFGLPYHAQVSVSKGAIEGLTKALAAEYAPKVRVNCIAPSLTDTPLAASLLNNEQKREASNQRHPLKRVGKPEDIANMATFLLSEQSSWITGQILHIDGGLSTLKI